MRRNNLSFAGVAFVLVLIFPGISALAQSVTPKGNQSQTKEHTVRVLLNNNGQITESDTVIVVKKGDNLTYSAGNAVIKADTIILSGDGKTRERKVTVIINDNKGSSGKDSVRATCIVTSGDTLGNRAIHDMKWLGDGKRMIIMQDTGGRNFDVAAPGPGTQIRMDNPWRDPFAFDPSDPDIVSYKKKDVGKDQEKITIIRKKKTRPAEVKNVEVKVER